MQAQEDQGTIMQKAQKRKQGASSSTTGMALVDRFPYSRLTVDQIIRLFKVYQINLGHSLDDSYTIIDSIQKMPRIQFESTIKNLLSAPSCLQQQSVTLSLDHLRSHDISPTQDAVHPHPDRLQMIPYEYS